MILITGATGHLGTATINFLLKKLPPTQIAAFVRDESKATALAGKGVTIRVGSYDDTASLDTAVQGIKKILLIAGTDEDNRFRQHQQVIDAAQKAGVPFVAYTSRTMKDRATMANRLMDDHFQTEDYLRASGLTYAIFRNVLYMDAIPQFVGPAVFDAGIHLPAGQGRVPFALRAEMGEAMANVLVSDTAENRMYTLTGTKGYSFADVATILTDLSDKVVTYTPVEPSAFARQLKDRGLPDGMVQRITAFLTDIANGQEEEVSSDLKTLLGRNPASLREGLKDLYNL